MWEVSMRHDDQIFTVFGGSFVADGRAPNSAAKPAPASVGLATEPATEATPAARPPRKLNDLALGPLAAIAIAALAGATIPAIAFTIAHRLRDTEAARWNPPAQVLMLPPAIHDEPVF
jgi:hypothetical protein